MSRTSLRSGNAATSHSVDRGTVWRKGCVWVCVCHVRSYSSFQRPTAQRSCRRRAREVDCEFVGFVDVLAVSEQQPDLARKHVVPVVLVGKLRVVKEPRTGLGHLAEVVAGGARGAFEAVS